MNSRWGWQRATDLMYVEYVVLWGPVLQKPIFYKALNKLVW
jgi:hypothetical protein